jgi:glycosyltransferase involved in cell wall biosynthesis
MSVSLLSNIPHYHHLAEAFDKAEALDCYVTVLSQMNDKISTLFPTKFRKKIMGRRLRVPEGKVKQLLLPEALAKVPPKLGFYSIERGYYLNNYLFDYLASRSIPESNVIHFVNSIGLITAMRSKRWGAKVICDSRQEHPLFHQDVLRDEAARLGVVATCIQNLSYRDKMLREFELADHIVVPSEHAKRTFVERGFHLDKVHVLNYGVESDLFYPNRNTDGVFRVLYVGQITYRKGIQYLLEAFTKLNLSNAELKLVGAIDPGFRPILARYEGRFTHVPQLARVDLFKQYGQSSIYVLPSLADAYPLTVLEALASGLPVVISENTGTADIVHHGEHGFIVPIRNVEAIQRAILAAYESPDLVARMSENAAALARAQTWERYGLKAVSLYRNLGLL